MSNLIDYDQDDNAVSEILRLITELSKDEIDKIWEGFCFYFAFQYLDEENIRIPYIGDLTFEKLKDKDVIVFKKHENLKKMIYQLKKAKKSGRVLDIDIVKLLQRRIKNNLKKNDSVKIEI